ncbi:MAG: hypothetical protein COV47_02725 [Candidatus Diapherotrites archaeon CG11_big_fil_rev_8_21_14_0_20_37_9]|nr:MAG: hypothetical protein COV47_02725 [Candidatus Diapherotrites archaeon CG11_big_fil_rev_8_21_14_0_20_37_9]
MHICSTSKILIQETSEILRGFGSKHYFRRYKKKDGEKDGYKVEVYRPHDAQFMALIGSRNPKHLDKFEIGQKFGFCPPKTTSKQRRDILKGLLNPHSLYAGVG